MSRIMDVLRRYLKGKSIIRTMMFSFLTVNILLLLLLGLLSIRDSTASLTEELTQSSYKIMEQAARGLSFNLEEATRPLVILAGHYSVRALMNPGRQLDVEGRIQHERNLADVAFGVTSLQSFISDILILGENGYVNNLDGRITLRWNYPFTEQDWFRQAVSGTPNRGFIPLGLHNQDYYMEKYISKYDQPTLSIALPVNDHTRKPIGAVIANLDLNKVSGMFELTANQNNQSVFMIDSRQTIIVHKDAEAIGTRLAFKGIERIHAEESGSFITDIDGRETLVTFHPTTVKGWKMVSTIPMSVIRGQADSLKSNLFGFIYLCLLLNLLISIVITVRISRPFGRLLSALDKIGEESVYVISNHYKYRELNVIGGKFKELVLRIQTLVRQNYQSELARKDAELKTLQSQINPHFLFNTLQLLQTEIVCGSTEESNHLVLSLSSLLRYSMKQSEEMVELGREIQNVKDYLYILNKKYDNRIDIEYRIPDQEILKHRTIKLILQPIIENVVLHGFGENPVSARVRIGAVSVKKGILVAIRDNGKGMTRQQLRMLRAQLDDPDHRPEHIGLYNVNQRIRLKFGPDYGLRIRSKPGAFTAVYVVLPKV
ncbi:Two-component sensor histidine kinase [Thermobacillus xylanilyticus]|uniref:Two-component sensor histidine kinase n=1 Tax=Thermobacillus xylanilyticus TaxID=76633 RepID=A0ABN7S7C2_THEXY|nr:sensor histidine kinase [Thermobacillus xylanilyticus]CAG5091604.1 Two-component sensor histidine kinase [Thermobacillus xylanilyticus]